MDIKKVAIITLAIALVILGMAMWVKGQDNTKDTDESVFCTLDAFLCPDGTWIGRTGPNCEFVCLGE